MFVVYQDGKPADSNSYPECAGWDNCRFSNLKDAQIYVIMWAYPYSRQTAEEYLNRLDIRVNCPIDLSMSEYPVIMEIREE